MSNTTYKIEIFGRSAITVHSKTAAIKALRTSFSGIVRTYYNHPWYADWTEIDVYDSNCIEREALVTKITQEEATMKHSMTTPAQHRMIARAKSRNITGFEANIAGRSDRTQGHSITDLHGSSDFQVAYRLQSAGRGRVVNYAPFDATFFKYEVA